MKKVLLSLIVLTSMTSVYASGYGGYDQEEYEYENIVISVKGPKAQTCDESKAGAASNVSVSGCYDLTDLDSSCECAEVKKGFECVYSKRLNCTPAVTVY